MRIALLGYGRMGREVERVAEEGGHRVVARLDRGDDVTPDALGEAEVAVDFTVPDVVVGNVRKAAAAGVDLVVGTTGWYDRLGEVREAVERADVGLVWSPNFSLGVHLFFRAARQLARLADAFQEYDVHVLEAHHRHKLDHPSGTARKVSDLLVGALSGKDRWREGPPEGPADPRTLWVTAVRAGEIPGTHVVGLDGPDDRIELRHEAHGRTGFARGALAAALWIRGRKGVHTLEDMLDDRFGAGGPRTEDDG